MRLAGGTRIGNVAELPLATSRGLLGVRSPRVGERAFPNCRSKETSLFERHAPCGLTLSEGALAEPEYDISARLLPSLWSRRQGPQEAGGASNTRMVSMRASPTETLKDKAGWQFGFNGVA
jgi:hypothetical protein